MGKLEEIDLGLQVIDLPEPVYNCQKCFDKDWIVDNGSAKRCECFIDRIRKEIDRAIGKHTVETYNDFQKAFTLAMSKSKKSSCWIHGATGLGKSALLSHWIKRKHEGLLLISGVDLPELFLQQNSEGQWLKIKQDFSSYKMIVIDDIDKCWPFTTSIKNSIYKFIDDIQRNDKQQFLVTSNTSMVEFCSIWPDHQKEPLLRRLQEKCFTI